MRGCEGGMRGFRCGGESRVWTVKEGGAKVRT